MNNGKTRSSLMAIVAAYLLYTAYELYQGRGNPDTTMTAPVMYLFIALFALAAAGLLVYAWRLWRQSGKQEEEKPPASEDKINLKG